eukprot:366332-Chlamydomonas_euryale.AAC.6
MHGESPLHSVAAHARLPGCCHHGAAAAAALAAGGTRLPLAPLQQRAFTTFASTPSPVLLPAAELAASPSSSSPSPAARRPRAPARRGRGLATEAAALDAATLEGDAASSGGSDGGDQGFSYGARKVVRLGGRRAGGPLGGLTGIVHVQNTNNNIFVTLTDAGGNVKAWTSAGTVGFKNARKSLPVAAEKAAEELARRALKLGYTSASVKLKGVGKNKQYAVQSLNAAGLHLTRLMDVTPIPYNGCRRPKRRRV